MDHTGGYYMAIAILAALYHRARTGEGQWVDVSCTESGAALNGPAVLDYTVNGRPLRRDGMPNSNRSQSPAMAPHGIYPSAPEPAGVDGLGETDNWVAIACRTDEDWRQLVDELSGGAGPDDAGWAGDERLATLAGRLAHEDELDGQLARWTATRGRYELAAALRARGVPATAVARPGERIDDDPATGGLGAVAHGRAPGHGRSPGRRPARAPSRRWTGASSGAPPASARTTTRCSARCSGLSAAEIDELRAEGVI